MDSFAYFPIIYLSCFLSRTHRFTSGEHSCLIFKYVLFLVLEPSLAIGDIKLNARCQKKGGVSKISFPKGYCCSLFSVSFWKYFECWEMSALFPNLWVSVKEPTYIILVLVLMKEGLHQQRETLIS